VGALCVNVRSAQEMLEAVLQILPQTDILLMAAAVADFRPTVQASQKIKKAGSAPSIELEHTPDILARVAEVKAQTGRPRLTVGFAAESQNLLDNAQAKLQAKRLDLVVANDITAPDAGFSVDTNRVVLLRSGTEPEILPLMGKHEVAEAILAWVAETLQR
jgi:phosphopantothenoylcysteine decarboxylase/phosphopantothenate--cysteine ligase